jgi:tetratricopeptide (TPR) repeat protein
MTESPSNVIEQLKRLEERLPPPLAASIKRYRDLQPERHSERIEALLKIYEVVVKLLAAVAAKMYLLEGASSPTFRECLKDFRAPSLGKWRDLLREGLRPFDPKTAPAVVQELNAWYLRGNFSAAADVRDAFLGLCATVPLRPPEGKVTTAKIVDLLVTYRNKGSGHGSRVSDDEYRLRHDYIVTLVFALLEGLSGLEPWVLGYVEEVRVRGGEHYVTLRTGHGREFDLREVRAENAIQDQRLYIFRFDSLGAPEFALDLSPFLLFRPCPKCSASQAFIFNSGGKIIEYLSYQCGHFLLVDDPSGELANIEGFLTGKVPLEILFEGKTLGLASIHSRIGASRESRERARALGGIGRGLQQREQFVEAETVFREALNLDPDASDAALGLGISRFAGGAEADAVLDLVLRSVELAPDSSHAHYALARLGAFLGRDDLASEHRRSAESLDPANSLYRRALTVSDETSHDNGARLQLCRDLVTAAAPVLPEIRWWLSALPPWSWISRWPALGAAAFAFATTATAAAFSFAELNRIMLLWFLNIGFLLFLGLYAPYCFGPFLERLFSDLRAVVTLPVDIFRRWFLAEIIPFAGSFHAIENGSRYGPRALLRYDRGHFVSFIGGLALFLPFQTACALGMDRLELRPGPVARFVLYYLEVYVLAWVPVFAVRSLLFIRGFRELPIRHFVDMPDSVSLKPVGTFYLRVATLGTAAFVLFTTQHYLYRTHLTVRWASLGFILVVYSLFFVVMFASQAAIRLTMIRLRDRRLTEYAGYLESAFQEMMNSPSEASTNTLGRHRSTIRSLREGLRISGFTPGTWIWFLGLTAVEIAVMMGYLVLVARGAWMK